MSRVLYNKRLSIYYTPGGYDIRTVHAKRPTHSAVRSGTWAELLGHKDVKTTLIYTHVLNRGGLAVRSLLDV